MVAPMAAAAAADILVAAVAGSAEVRPAAVVTAVAVGTHSTHRESCRGWLDMAVALALGRGRGLEAKGRASVPVVLDRLGRPSVPAMQGKSRRPGRDRGLETKGRAQGRGTQHKMGRASVRAMQGRMHTALVPMVWGRLGRPGRDPAPAAWGRVGVTLAPVAMSSGRSGRLGSPRWRGVQSRAQCPRPMQSAGESEHGPAPRSPSMVTAQADNDPQQWPRPIGEPKGPTGSRGRVLAVHNAQACQLPSARMAACDTTRTRADAREEDDRFHARGCEASAACRRDLTRMSSPMSAATGARGVSLEVRHCARFECR